MGTITRDDIVRGIAREAGVNYRTAEDTMDAFCLVIEKELGNGNKVMVPDFGIFEIKHRNARLGRNPHTGEAVPIPARNQMNFTPCKRLKRYFESQ